MPIGRLRRPTRATLRLEGWVEKLFCNTIQEERGEEEGFASLLCRGREPRRNPSAHDAGCPPDPSCIFGSPPACSRHCRYVNRSKFRIKEQKINDITVSARPFPSVTRGGALAQRLRFTSRESVVEMSRLLLCCRMVPVLSPGDAAATNVAIRGLDRLFQPSDGGGMTRSRFGPMAGDPICAKGLGSKHGLSFIARSIGASGSGRRSLAGRIPRLRPCRAERRGRQGARRAELRARHGALSQGGGRQ